MKKKISPNLIGFIVAIVATVGSLWFYFSFLQKKNYYILDNPTTETIQVSIDDKPYIVAPEQQVLINLKKGAHRMITHNNQEINFSVKTPRGVLNPTKSAYFIFGLPYGVGVNVDSVFEQNVHKYQNKVYHGDIRIDSAAYIDDFYYNLNEKFPKVTKKSENHKLRRKIFRKDDFKQYYFQNFE
ncbi:hypothetical protein [Ornithobacterium rhinotracheale]|uniref:Uncharacterized protein n=2 Tax=Ornithobacterium rhinotracheale TaxID=28251 RepID=I4A2P0_ORNRL|nr:hypothetical protein [Ornithobacterium rhinotracheale]AFL98224.1 hypothetical protein Ornrh_2092 [Ornithobacterium rhinotracheale DSM 15997]AIQ00704.1 hypothetical protein Q785_10350 [Ornithobacterium rhinotracheale ORT-UMN 88]KGB66376.1 hypothetical protein Q787_10185 [Ornithobacterium rhinotracheale H06-030791]MBN3662670.1 hypothetical protein [Ornithobacterium rhinotracheale]MCK0193475.1 hypothetical protein [Ornithobacterium rhinotracheale]